MCSYMSTILSSRVMICGIVRTNNFLKTTFDIKDLGELKYFLELRCLGLMMVYLFLKESTYLIFLLKQRSLVQSYNKNTNWRDLLMLDNQMIVCKLICITSIILNIFFVNQTNAYADYQQASLGGWSKEFQVLEGYLRWINLDGLQWWHWEFWLLRCRLGM